ncbi:hypothetical protein TIFTF001_032444 [Ficus carica]|uniref:Uncharacterized protein n=1 Tax=Ficus carica TaxID=3494 RepID=A0AA88DWM1_FICCA|nr:hypothetical protein TIFTF001_032444 [Ficus carica]
MKQVGAWAGVPAGEGWGVPRVKEWGAGAGWGAVGAGVGGGGAGGGSSASGRLSGSVTDDGKDLG